tara:strand:+ start:168 stop:347 length:180 start_codon:yes stop_codon:yes gene_type:complete
MKKPTLEDCFFIALIYFDEFIKRTLMGLYYSWQKYDYWTHNRAVAKAAKEAEENPPTLL